MIRRRSPRGLATRDGVVLLAAAAIVGAGILLGLDGKGSGQGQKPGMGSDAFRQETPVTGDVELDNGKPRLRAFTKDLLAGGQPDGLGDNLPFVVGDELELDADGRNVDEYRWSCNGKVVLDGGKEWSSASLRPFPLDKPGTYRFTVEARDSKSGEAAEPIEKTLEVPGLQLTAFAPEFNEDAEHVVTGTELGFQADAVTPLRLVEYRYRLLVNGSPVKQEGEEWTGSDWFLFTCAKPGKYRFRLQARRANVDQVESELDWPAGPGKELIVADAVIEDFSHSGTEHCAVNSAVTLDASVESKNDEEVEVRFGFHGMQQDDPVEWIAGDDGKVWGTPQRRWVPLRAGNFHLRAEVRIKGREAADDFREILILISEGPENF